jgi:hypothetical protein
LLLQAQFPLHSHISYIIYGHTGTLIPKAVRAATI